MTKEIMNTVKKFSYLNPEPGSFRGNSWSQNDF